MSMAGRMLSMLICLGVVSLGLNYPLQASPGFDWLVCHRLAACLYSPPSLLPTPRIRRSDQVRVRERGSGSVFYFVLSQTRKHKPLQ